MNIGELIEATKDEITKKGYSIKETVDTGSYYELMAPSDLDDVEYINSFLKKFPSQYWKIHKELFFDTDESWKLDQYYILYIKMKNMNNGYDALESLYNLFKEL